VIRGQVQATREAVISLPLHAPGGGTRDLDVVIDTGFSGYLTLPPDTIATLQLPFYGTADYQLADGSAVQFPIHTATVVWDGHDRDVYVLASDGGALVGIQMLYGHRLYVDVIDGGEVTIEARP
jgi:clan AA aspartic protease